MFLVDWKEWPESRFHKPRDQQHIFRLMKESIASRAQDAANEPRILYCLDFDGVLCDSVHETFLSGWKACKLLWNDCDWMNAFEHDPQKMNGLEDDFRFVRPILYVGWEAILLIRLLAVSYQHEIAGTDLDVHDPSSNKDAVFRGFHNPNVDFDFKAYALRSWGLEASVYSDAMANARNNWIRDDEASWLDAHGFYEGACKAVKQYLEEHGNEDVYVITTKAKEFALRLLEKQDLVVQSSTTSTTSRSSSNNNSTTVNESHVFGLGSGPKASVIQQILQARKESSPDTEFVAVMVEDKIGTLDKISKSPVGDKVVPVVASWGYNSVQQLEDVIDKPYKLLPIIDQFTADELLFDEKRRTKYAEMLKQKDPTGKHLSFIFSTMMTVLVGLHLSHSNATTNRLAE